MTESEVAIGKWLELLAKVIEKSGVKRTLETLFWTPLPESGYTWPITLIGWDYLRKLQFAQLVKTKIEFRIDYWSKTTSDFTYLNGHISVIDHKKLAMIPKEDWPVLQ